MNSIALVSSKEILIFFFSPIIERQDWKSSTHLVDLSLDSEPKVLRNRVVSSCGLRTFD